MSLEATGQPREAITFRSPVTAYVLEKPVVQGMHVSAGQTLYKLADLSVVWVEADVYEQEVAGVRVGQRATVTLNAYPSDAFEGRATQTSIRLSKTRRGLSKSDSSSRTHADA